nr:helix-turn-helix transcriptional regulator [Agrobacterium tumefaciens]
MRAKQPNATDVHVGSRIKLRRKILGISQERLGESLGVTFQQVQKYERGINRVGASRLQSLATVLNVPIAFFFEDAPGSEWASIENVDVSSGGHKFIASIEGTQLSQNFMRIRDIHVRRQIFNLVKALSENEE